MVVTETLFKRLSILRVTKMLPKLTTTKKRRLPILLCLISSGEKRRANRIMYADDWAKSCAPLKLIYDLEIRNE